jgi:membrane-bound inhibitor of C-type lysozyme
MKSIFQSAPITLGLLGFLAAGCTTGNNETTAAKIMEYQCPGGEVIEVTFPAERGEEVMVMLPEQDPLTLPQVEAASGAKYSDGTTTFWEKDGEALVEVNGEITLQGCTAQ